MVCEAAVAGCGKCFRTARTGGQRDERVIVARLAGAAMGKGCPMENGGVGHEGAVGFSLNLQIWREQAKRARQDLSELEIDDAEAPEIGAIGDVAWLGIEVADPEIALEDGE